MQTKAKIADRDPKKALYCAVAMPGLGQAYNGELFKGLCFFCMFCFLPLIFLRMVMLFPDRLLIAGAAVSFFGALAIYLFAIIDARRTAAARGAGYILKGYNRWYFYIVLWCLCALWTGRAVFGYAQDRILQFCHIVTGSMEPSVLKGDYIIFDKTMADRFSPRKGDIVLFRYPDDRSKLYVKRIAGLPGDTIAVDGAPAAVVPHGHVFVLGDNRAHAEDSRRFGPVPLRDVTGRARQVYLSVGLEGVRWGRLGKTLP